MSEYLESALKEDLDNKASSINDQGSFDEETLATHNESHQILDASDPHLFLAPELS
eukprot:CAMPEP_0195333394 /NCGR_PEP_ID=MMETSP0708-20121125/14025_1 /TAXON_ID=33640 /ORGANISM="Asterionellopsis glacialis, Strain CCMP134" /LENGTH=55 /DNA_ID=CAMNT_0040402691 /DNA_START=90 /DNA_END=253 /DNA_ORIENTATION=+